MLHHGQFVKLTCFICVYITSHLCDWYKCMRCWVLCNDVLLCCVCCKLSCPSLFDRHRQKDFVNHSCHIALLNTNSVSVNCVSDL